MRTLSARIFSKFFGGRLPQEKKLRQNIMKKQTELQGLVQN